MRRFIPRSSVFAWLTAMAVVAIFTEADVRAQGEHESDAHADEGTHDAEPAHREKEGGHGSDEHDSAGMGDHGSIDYEQPPMSFDPKLFFWSLGLFLLFLFVARKVAWGPMIQGLDAREARVNRALHDAEAARIEAEKLLADHDARMGRVQDEAKEIVAAARKEAEAEKTRIIAEADAETATLRDQAIAEIEAAHRQAAEDLNSQIGQQVAMATEHVLGHG